MAYSGSNSPRACRDLSSGCFSVTFLLVIILSKEKEVTMLVWWWTRHPVSALAQSPGRRHGSRDVSEVGHVLFALTCC